MDLIYLDNNATTKIAPEVLAAMLPYFDQCYGNPSSVHRFGQLARQAIDVAREQVAALIGSSPGEIIFTGGGTEAVNLAIRGLLASRSPRKRIVTCHAEHSATRELCQQLAKEGFDIVWLPVDQQGHINLDTLATSLTDDTALISLLYANNETGVLSPVDQIASLCRAKKIPFHCDGTQALGKIPVDVVSLGVDALSFAPHKFHGPKGVGCLYLRRGVRLRPQVIGGPHESSRRGGTENVPAIVGTGVACDLARASFSNGDLTRVANLRDRLERDILAALPDTQILGDTAHRVPNTTNIGFSRLEADAIVISLSEQSLCVSAGSACSSGSLEPSHVLIAMGLPPRLAHGGIRFSLSKYTTDQEITRALQILPPVIQRLRAILPVGAQ
ncbi:MAG TPA: aminotransferase class V-fold PLP-dependent enzyme [Tepidisphaeraceae bacterium]|jgi:cysteine desulfurase|nr:aminotransferase class V-fold PLP-dependent enzyme [Tepidisphaeraceae bacterium]